MKNLDRYMIMALFAGYMGKLLLTGASLSDAAIVLVLAAANFLYNSQIQNKQIVELKQELREFKNQSTAEIKKLSELSEELKTNVAGVKIASGLRSAR